MAEHCTKISRAALFAAALAACLLATAGCAGPLTRWMTDLRSSQGDAALANNNLVEAQKEYALALALAPKNEHARKGLAQVLYLRARNDFQRNKLDDAQLEIERARRYAPDDPATQALAAKIEQAKIRREIVIANFPTYEAMGTAMADSLKTLAASNREMQKQVRAFSYDYDTSHLTRAIIESYDLEQEVHRVTQRLIAYRSFVQSGVPKARQPLQTETPNLLPIP